VFHFIWFFAQQTSCFLPFAIPGSEDSQKPNKMKHLVCDSTWSNGSQVHVQVFLNEINARPRVFPDTFHRAFLVLELRLGNNVSGSMGWGL
jgi:hypothetical protein